MTKGKILYQVTAEISRSEDREAYLAWLSGGHVADVTASGAMSGCVAVQAGQDGGPDLVVCSYRFEDAAAFMRYENGPAIALRAEGVERFGPASGRRISWSRFVGAVVYDSEH